VKLTVGTRGSRLSIVQTDLVLRELKAANPGLEVDVKVIKTTGDIMAESPLDAIGGEGVFEKEVDRAVISGEVDFAVHSMKDVPIKRRPQVEIIAVPRRDSPHDVLVSRDGSTLADLPKGAVIGTGSPRREAQLRCIRPDVIVKPIRGNVDTRIRKMKGGLYDALILAEAGLRRLNLDVSMVRLRVEEFTPTPGQGALAVVARRDRTDIQDVLKKINHHSSMVEALCERAFLAQMGGGCRNPIGALAKVSGERLSLLASLITPRGEKIMAQEDGWIGGAEDVGLKVARGLLSKMGG